MLDDPTSVELLNKFGKSTLVIDDDIRTKCPPV